MSTHAINLTALNTSINHSCLTIKNRHGDTRVLITSKPQATPRKTDFFCDRMLIKHERCHDDQIFDHQNLMTRDFHGSYGLRHL